MNKVHDMTCILLTGPENLIQIKLLFTTIFACQYNDILSKNTYALGDIAFSSHYDWSQPTAEAKISDTEYLKSYGYDPNKCTLLYKFMVFSLFTPSRALISLYHVSFLMVCERNKYST